VKIGILFTEQYKNNPVADAGLSKERSQLADDEYQPDKHISCDYRSKKKAKKDAWL